MGKGINCASFLRIKRRNNLNTYKNKYEFFRESPFKLLAGLDSNF